MNLFLNLFNCLGRFLIVHRDANQLTARFFQAMNFGYCRLHIRRLGRTHALHDHFVAAADRQVAYANGTCVFSMEHYGFSPHDTKHPPLQFPVKGTGLEAVCSFMKLWVTHFLLSSCLLSNRPWSSIQEQACFGPFPWKRHKWIHPFS